MANFIWPVSGTISSGYGPRDNRGGVISADHKGIDIACPDKSTVVASAAGRITFAGIYGKGGNTIIIKHADGFETIYCHLSKFIQGLGSQVAQGQAIALSGGALGELGAGNSNAPHLHFEVVKDGVNINPVSVLTGTYANARNATPAQIAEVNKLAKDNPSLWSNILKVLKITAAPVIPQVGADIVTDNPVTGGVIDAAANSAKVLGYLSTPDNWKRIGLGLLGALIILIGTIELLSNDGAVKTISGLRGA